MLDTVRPSPSGDKTSEQVAIDHRNRVRRIVDCSDIKDKDSVQIIQLSAELAKKWRSAHTSGAAPSISEESYRKSNYELFVSSVTEILEVQRPRIERQRLISICTCAAALKDSVQTRINQPSAIVEASFPLQDLKDRVMGRKAAVRGEYQAIIKECVSAAKRIKIAIGVDKDDGTQVKRDRSLGNHAASEFSCSDQQSLEESLNNTNETVKAFENALANLISEHNSFVISTAQQINIPSRDLLCSGALHSFRTVKLEKTTKTGSRRVEKKGLGGKVSRFFGRLNPFSNDWGYEYERYEEVVTDTEGTKKKICARLADAYERYTSSMTDWEEKNFHRSMDIIEAEIKSSEESYLRKKAAAVEAEALAKLDADLASLIQQISNDLPDAEFTKCEEMHSSVFSTKQMEVSSYVEAVLGLSRTALQRQHRAVAQSFVSKIGCENYTPIIVSWDSGSTDEFIWQTGIADAQVVCSPVSGSAIPPGKHRCLFVLVNAIQYGAALKQISALKLDAALSKQDYVVWVVQDLQELLTGDRAAEGLSQMAELSGVTRIPCKSSMRGQPPFSRQSSCEAPLFDLIRKTDYHLYTPEETIARARSRIGEEKYALPFNNCEHFAIWCKTGIHESHQVNAWLTRLSDIALRYR